MPSPVSGRRAFEWALRVLSVAVLAVIALRAWDSAHELSRRDNVRQDGIAGSLPAWTSGAYASVHATLDSVPSTEERDWLSALQHSGTSVSWQSSRIVPVAATLNRIADPEATAELSASVPAGSRVGVIDRVGVLDTLVAAGSGVRLEIPGAVNVVGVSTGAGTAWAGASDSVLLKRILVEGAASWETKFTIAALAERGWKVDAVTHVAPGVDVRLGNPARPDTSRYAAIIAVDSSATLVATGASSFVRSGGGLITLHDAASIGPHPSNSVILERRADGEVRASRFGSGRIVRVGYGDMWRDRMTGGDSASDPVAQHRAWFARAVASVAYAPRIPISPDSAADPAPLASLVDRIGPQAAALSESPVRVEVPSSVLFAMLAISLLLELLSRRLRGAR